MIKSKKILISLTLFLFFSSCGYTPIFSKKDVNFIITKIEFLGDQDVKKNISKELSSYKNKPGKEKEISLVITSSRNTTIASKNSKGEAETNRVNIEVNAKIILAENNFFIKNFNKSSIYKVIDRKSEQMSIERKLVENLCGEIAQQIIFEILKSTK